MSEIKNQACKTCGKYKYTDAIPNGDYVYLGVFIEARKVDIKNIQSAIWKARFERIRSYCRIKCLGCDK